MSRTINNWNKVYKKKKAFIENVKRAITTLKLIELASQPSIPFESNLDSEIMIDEFETTREEQPVSQSITQSTLEQERSGLPSPGLHLSDCEVIDDNDWWPDSTLEDKEVEENNVLEPLDDTISSLSPREQKLSDLLDFKELKSLNIFFFSNVSRRRNDS